MSMCKEDGTRVDNPTKVKKQIVGFLKRLLSEVSSNTPINQEVLRKAPPGRLTHDQCNDLLKGVTEGEIKDVLFSLKDNKALASDGYNALFFKKAWGIVGNDVVRAIKSFFTSGCLLREFNATTIALIPKVPDPTKLKTISCCNTIYKCISKIIANRIKPVLPHCRCKQQTTFVEGRRIGNNILLAQELLRNYHRDQGTPQCALKVDLMKAYDTVRWDFVLVVLKTIGFPQQSCIMDYGVCYYDQVYG
ncbi:uncharacterized protein LOC118348915 [Juglans regia]|uniref:Uncharacterized protein LOC118348915 n=1 Tax=Juglans regia TaxID=51240 RepID=A0A6P9EJ16_JUGRE|nr:uncharacterized protein LOC118348915 [Juglans regia]